MTCSTMQDRIVGVLAGAGDERERLEVEAHSASCARCATAYADLITASVALDRAYAPLRAASVALSPARVRLAVRRPQPAPASLRVTRLAARFTEVALAAAVTAFAFIGSASIAPKTTIVDESAPDPAPVSATTTAENASVIRWFRIGRYAATPDLGEAPVAIPSREYPQTLPGLHDRTGLQR